MNMASPPLHPFACLLLAASPLAFGCSPPDPVWAMDCDARPEPEVVPGTGEGAFVHADEGPLVIQYGSQGGSHIWMGVQLRGMGGPEVTVQYGILDAADPTIVHSGPNAERVALSYDSAEETSETAGLFGYLYDQYDENTGEPLPGPSGRDVILWAEVSDVCHQGVRGEAPAHVK